MALSIDKRRKNLGSERMEESSSQSRKWENLDIDLLNQIFSYIPITELSSNVSSVCKSWQLGCWEVLFWRQNMLDLNLAMPFIGNLDSGTEKSMEHRDIIREWLVHIDVKLMKLLKSLMDGEDARGLSLEYWGSSIKDIFIPTDLHISDELLLYLAERTPGLESLVLSRPSRISREGFAKALSNWKNVKHISFGRFSGIYFPQIIEEIGRNCTELTSLHIHHPCLHLNAENLMAVLRNLPKLKTVKFEGACMFGGESYRLLWMESSMLEAIYFSDCFLVRENLIPLDRAQSVRFIYDRENNSWKIERLK